MTLKELLTQSKEKIKDRRNWTRGTLVKYNPGGGYCFCARGALYDTACGGTLSTLLTSHDAEALFQRPDVKEAEDFLNACAVQVDDISPNVSSPITNLNDTPPSERPETETHAKVLAAYDCAIEKA